MADFSSRPRLIKSTLVVLDSGVTTAPKVISFQYNPERLRRSLSVPDKNMPSSGDVARMHEAPVETLSLEFEVDAIDALEAGDKEATQRGIHARLAALEALVHPETEQVLTNLKYLALGLIDIVPGAAPLVLFVYGSKRILPVTITQLDIVEEAHDANLNPIRATVTLGLRVLTYNELSPDHKGHALYLAYLTAKESMAKLGMSHLLESPIATALRAGSGS